MSDIFRCDNKGGLVAFLYDECTPDERSAVAKHLEACGACARELRALSSTRVSLASWVNPEAPTGFRLDPEPAAGPVLVPQAGAASASGSQGRAAWWRAPLPAWAQMAAAVALFSSGMVLGSWRGASTAPSAVAVDGDHVTSSELASVVEQLRGERAQPVATRVVERPTIDDAAITRRVDAMIRESEERQREELARRTLQLVRDFDIQRKVDIQQFQQAVDRVQGTTGTEVLQHRQMLNELIQRVSGSGR